MEVMTGAPAAPDGQIIKEWITTCNVKCIQTFLEGEGNVDVRISKDGSTALHVAAALPKEADSTLVARVLLSNGANPNIPNKEGKTSVHVAASLGYTDLLELLLLNGGDPLLGDLRGCSSVDCAFQGHHHHTVNLLNHLLDTEEYNHWKNDKKMFTLSFIRREVMELATLYPDWMTESENSYYSSISDIQGKNNAEESLLLYPRINLRRKLPPQKCDSSVEQRFATFRVNCNKSLPCQEKSNKKFPSNQHPAWISSYHFLRSLQQKVEVCRVDSDSDSDMLALQHYLGRKLQFGDPSFSDSAQSYKPESTVGELNVAYLNTDASGASEATVNASYEEYVESASGELNVACLITDVSSGASDATVNTSYENYVDQSSKEENAPNNTFSFRMPSVNENSKISDSELNCAKIYDSLSLCSESEAEECVLHLEQEIGENVTDHNHIHDFCATLNLMKPTQKTEYFKYRMCGMSPSPKRELCKPRNTSKHSNISVKNSFELNKPIVNESFMHHTGSGHTTPQPSLKMRCNKSVPSSTTSCPSLLSIAEEFLYQDSEAGIQFIERRCPTTAVLSSHSGTKGEATAGLATNQQLGINNKLAADRSCESLVSVTDSIKAMSVEALLDNLKKLGFEPGPITPSTHRVYMRLLLRLRKKSCSEQNNNSSPEYSKELRLVLSQPQSVPWEAWISLEKEMSLPFCYPDPTRHWRNGTNKTCFNYLLLDPRITQNLPLMGSAMEEKDKMHCFVSAVFYVGKGSRNRPYCHLYEAIKKQKNTTQNRKVKRITEIWAEDLGVVSLHVFQNTIPVEAWTREAAMISAIGLKNLCNSIQGTFYGPSSTWRGSKRHHLGTYLLLRAFNIFLQEGERQIRPCDIALPAWTKQS